MMTTTTPVYDEANIISLGWNESDADKSLVGSVIYCVSRKRSGKGMVAVIKHYVHFHFDMSLMYIIDQYGKSYWMSKHHKKLDIINGK